MLKNFDEMIDTLKAAPNRTVVIAAAQTPTAMDAAVMAKKENLADCIMTGDKKIIEEYLNAHHPDYTKTFNIYDTGACFVSAVTRAVELVKDGTAQLILKGKCDTGILLKAVLDKENGLRTGNVMSDVLVYETPERLVLMGDGGFVPDPDLKAKISIAKNCVAVAQKLGNPLPKVAMLTHSEKVSPKSQSTVDAAIIAKMNHRGQIKGCIIDGPLAFDNAVSVEAARMKGIKGEVAGDADVLVVPNIEAGNIFGKCLTYYCKYRVAHVVMGAKVPIIIASRADDAETKFLSMALGILSA